MTTNERAKQAILRSTIPPHFSQWWAITISPEQIEALTHTIESAIVAAVEEDRKTRECCQDVKEGCARIADKFTQYAETGRRIAVDIRSRSLDLLRARLGGKTEELPTDLDNMNIEYHQHKVSIESGGADS